MDHHSSATKPPKQGHWWTGILVGNFEATFIAEPEYAHAPLYDRTEAARLALYASFRRWRFWAALAILVAATVICSLIDGALRISDNNGTAGAMLGFIIGLIAIQRAIYHCGLPVYREALSRFKVAEHVVGGNGG